MSEVQKTKPFNKIPTLRYVFNLIHRACEDIEKGNFVITDDSDKHAALLKKLTSLRETFNGTDPDSQEMAETLKALGSKLGPIDNVLDLLGQIIRSEAFNYVYLINDEEIDSTLIYLGIKKELNGFKNILITSILNHLKQEVHDMQISKEEEAAEIITKATEVPVILKQLKDLCASKVDIVNGFSIAAHQEIEKFVKGEQLDPYVKNVIIKALMLKANPTDANKSEFVKYFG